MPFNFFFSAAGLIFLIIGYYFIMQARRDWLVYRQSQAWRSVTGRVNKSQVTSSGLTHRNIGVSITYRYEVGGRRFTGERLCFGAEKAIYWTPRQAEKVIAPYPKDSRVTIHYEPGNPPNAVLERKYDKSGAIIGLVFIALGLAFSIPLPLLVK
jgi:hypothetical protein